MTKENHQTGTVSEPENVDSFLQKIRNQIGWKKRYVSNACVLLLWFMFVSVIGFFVCLVNVTLFPESWHLVEVREDKNSKLHGLANLLKENKKGGAMLEKIIFSMFVFLSGLAGAHLKMLWRYMTPWVKHKKYPQKEWEHEGLHYMRVIVSMNMFDGKQGKGGKYVDVPKMRTLDEVALSETFYDPYDPYVLNKMMEQARQRMKDGHKDDPFLYTNIDEDNADNWKKVKKKLTDQIVNRLSRLFSYGFVAEDHGLDVSSKKYVFGVTYEQNKEGLNDKVRILMMQEKNLKKLHDNYDIDNFIPAESAVSSYAIYQKERRKHLNKLYEIYEGQKKEQGNAQYALVRHLYLTSQDPVAGIRRLMAERRELILTNPVKDTKQE